MSTVRVKWDPDAALQAVSEGEKQGLESAARVLLELANQHVPRLSGELQDSGTIDFDGKVASVYYDTVYAAKQHQYRKYKHPGQGTAGWLRKACLKGRTVLLPFFGDPMKLVFSRGWKR